MDSLETAFQELACKLSLYDGQRPKLQNSGLPHFPAREDQHVQLQVPLTSHRQREIQELLTVLGADNINIWAEVFQDNFFHMFFLRICRSERRENARYQDCGNAFLSDYIALLQDLALVYR